MREIWPQSLIGTRCEHKDVLAERLEASVSTVIFTPIIRTSGFFRTQFSHILFTYSRAAPRLRVSASDAPAAYIYVLGSHTLNVASYAYLHTETDLSQYVRAVQHDWVTEFNAYIGPKSELAGIRTEELYATCQIGRVSSFMATVEPLGCTPDSEIDFRFCSGSEQALFGRNFALNSCGSLC